MKSTDECTAAAEQCLSIWNIPTTFKNYIKPIAKTELEKWKQEEQKSSKDTQHLIKLFKTYCGCGEYEDFSLYNNKNNVSIFSLDTLVLPDEFSPSTKEQQK